MIIVIVGLKILGSGVRGADTVISWLKTNQTWGPEGLTSQEKLRSKHTVQRCAANTT